MEPTKSFNLPLARYQAGSYFGDNDFFTTSNRKKHLYRCQTMVCFTDSHFYTINGFALIDILKNYKQTYRAMRDVAIKK